jgi:pre-mRNA-splicing factor ATP-dependent RNA helicase DHX15/PRP43
MDRKRAIDLDEPQPKKKAAQTTGTAADDIDTNNGVNPWTQRVYTEQFYKILEKRKTLPVLKFKPQIMEQMEKQQTVVLVGETGSGKVLSFGC